MPTPTMTTVPSSVDAIVISSGPNGLVAANLLVDHGWDVVVLEAQPTIGGAVHSDSSVQPGYVHHTYSSFYPFATASPVIRALELEQHGLTWSHAPAVVGTPFRDGRWTLVHHDAQATAQSVDQFAAGDGGVRAATVATGAPKIRWATLREQIIRTPALVASTGRRLILHLPRDWPWTSHWQSLSDTATQPLTT